MAECTNCKGNTGFGMMYGDYTVGFFCSKKECIKALHKKRGGTIKLHGGHTQTEGIGNRPLAESNIPG